jgi:hypothetical protein
LVHRKWCSKIFTPTESDLESDQFYTDCEDFGFEDYCDSEYYNSETDEGDEDDSEEWEDDDGDDGESGDEGPLGSISRARAGEKSDSHKGKYWTTSGESSTDDASPSPRPRKSKKKHTIWTKRLTPKKKKKTFWNDDGDFDFDGFVMDIGRSIVRLRNT